MVDSKSLFLKEKVEILFLVFSPGKFSGLAAALFPDVHGEEPARIQKSLNYYRQGGRTAATDIPNQLVRQWKFTGPARDLLFNSPVEFLACMPTELRARFTDHPRAGEILKDVDTKLLQARPPADRSVLHRHGIGRGYHVVHVTPAYDGFDITDALEKGQFDQKYLYLDRTAATRWHKLTGNPGKYSTFRHCQDTLEDLVTAEPWISLVPEIETVVVLGGGAAKKDDVIIQSLRAHRGDAIHPVQYVVIDTSVHMLLSTLQELERLVDPATADFVEIVGFVADFTSLETSLRILDKEGAGIHRHGKRAAFFLPGNTLANFNPEDIFKNIYDNSRTGDLLLFSLEIAVEGKEEKFADKLVERYVERELVQLVLPPIRPFLDMKGINVIGDLALQRIKATKVSRYWRDLLSICDAFTIEIRLRDEDADIDIVLATSSRYHLGALERCANAQGFDVLDDSIKVDQPHHEYRQILLERRAYRNAAASDDQVGPLA